MNFTTDEIKAIRAILDGFLPLVEEVTEDAFFNIEKDTEKYFKYADCLHTIKDIISKIDRNIEL